MLDAMIGKQWKLALGILRLTVGLIFLIHGLQKTIGLDESGGIQQTIQAFSQLNFYYPALVAWIVSLVELLGGGLLLLGFYTQAVALLFVLMTSVSFFLVHLPNGFFVANNGIEFHLSLISMNLCLLLSGGGLWALDSTRGHRSKWVFTGSASRIKPNP